MACCSLPATHSEWNLLLRRALALPRERILVPPHFIVRTLAPPHRPVKFGIDRRMVVSAAAASNGSSLPAAHGGASSSRGASSSSLATSRFSGVLLLLMPRPSAVDEAATSTTVAAAAGLPPPPYLDLCFPLERREAKMRAHSGEMSLPGGRCDAGETPEHAASREALEEIGVPAFTYDVLGAMSRVYSYPSRSFVEPIVALAKCTESPSSIVDRATIVDEGSWGVHPGLVRVASPDEVSSVHYLSLGDLLLRPETCHREIVREFSGTDYGKVVMPAFDTPDGARVWGLTAFIVSELIARLATVLNWSVPYTPQYGCLPLPVEGAPTDDAEGTPSRHAGTAVEAEGGQHDGNGSAAAAVGSVPRNFHNPYDEMSRQPVYSSDDRGVGTGSPPIRSRL